ncbi:MAG: mechanosensitive ion channel [Verrucomicrobiae bacterium]|nr:mechanosensitive ion channel [Verrucomicrobiae bacterium]
MRTPFTILCVLGFLLFGWGGDCPLLAQDPGNRTQIADATPREVGALRDSAVLESHLKEIETDSGLDDATKKILGDRYREALDSLKRAAEYREREATYRSALEAGPDTIKKTRSEISQLQRQIDAAEKSPPAKINYSDTELDSALTGAQTQVASLKAAKQGLEQKEDRSRLRPTQIRDRLPEARAELEAVQELLNGAGRGSRPGGQNQGQDSMMEKNRALRSALEAEIAMLEQEDLSFQVRDEMSEAAIDLADLKLTVAEKSFAALQSIASTRSTDTVDQAEKLLKSLDPNQVDSDETLVNLSGEISKLIDQSRQVSQAIPTTERMLAEREKEAEQIRDAHEDIREQLELGGLESDFSQTLFDQINLLPDTKTTAAQVIDSQEKLASARSGLFKLERATRQQALESGTEKSGAESKKADASLVAQLTETKESLSRALRSNYERLVRSLSDLDARNREIHQNNKDFRGFALEKLFWVRSSPMIGNGTMKSLPEAIAFSFGPGRLSDLKDSLKVVPVAFWVFTGALLLFLLACRPIFRRWLRDSGQKTRRISTDKYSHTLVAFVATVLLALPAFLVFFLPGIALMSHALGSIKGDWSYGLGKALVKDATLVFPLYFLIVLCRKGGLGEVHFRWSRDILRRVRHVAAWMIPVRIVAATTLLMVVNESGGAYLNSLGRLGGLFDVIGIGVLLALLMHPSTGISSVVNRDTPGSLFGRFRHVWFSVVIVTTVFFTGLLCVGYVFTALILIEQIEFGLTGILVGFVAYGMILRWFTIGERKLALEELREKRRARQEALAAKVEQSDEGEGEEGRIPEIKEDDQLEMSEVSGQTRRLIAFVVGAVLVFQFYSNLMQFGPVIEVFDQFKTFGGISIADIAMFVFVVVIVWEVTRNLPGLLEMLILRRLELDSGTRNAIVTLAKYVVYSIGAIVLFQNLGVDWSQFGWIAAALGVGIGFGLQEVVANFISGIILLFERPIRVGDIVTIDGIDGVVSRIQIRATTIINWDRKEFIVPNKQFVTGTLLNWTLSNPINRIVIIVGVAYGTDTEEAQEVLFKVARDHPLIMEEPAPLVSFEEFGDSALKLVLRCYLPNMDNRLKTISELHTAVDKRFKEAGIEIAFPQLDVHLRKES